MNQFAAERLIAISTKLTSVARIIERSPNNHKKISSSFRTGVLYQLSKIEEDCEALSLELCLDKIQRIKYSLPDSTYFSIAQQFTEFNERFYDETKRNLFMHVPKEKQRFYTEPHKKFGLDVERFPSAKDEIEEAGKCYAAGRNTACVLHLMRILEGGLSALGKHFGIPYSHTNWEAIINQIPVKIDEIEKRSNKPLNWQDDRKFYSEAGVHFKFLKDAYRNYAMHLHESYDEGKAFSLFTHASEFMRHLATKLSE